MLLVSSRFIQGKKENIFHHNILLKKNKNWYKCISTTCASHWLTCYNIMDETMGGRPLQANIAGHEINVGFQDDYSRDNLLDTCSSVMLKALPSSELLS